VRLALSRGLRRGAEQADRWRAHLVPRANAEFALPAEIGDYTDFYTSVHHATSIGRLFRPDNPLLPNYKWVPIGYHGRSSTIAVNRDFVRPRGQTMAPNAQAPTVGRASASTTSSSWASSSAPATPRGTSIPITEAADHLFGVCLLNDWSARDIQGGSTSRSDRSSPRASRRRSRRGS
jgi:fumarylacetoacetase